MGSDNLPHKHNVSNLRGIDAITGSSNFDICEVIINNILYYFNNHNGAISLLMKNSVVKNIIYNQHNNHYNITHARKLNIDANAEFNVSVNASLFFSVLNAPISYTCDELCFYSGKYKTTFGWVGDKFVYSTDLYKHTCSIDGISNFIWRQGIKHDCSKVMEVERISSAEYKNKLGNVIILEPNLIYGLLKSSDLKYLQVDCVRKYIIVTQSKVGQDTAYIEQKYPHLFSYLSHNMSYFNKRKSSIYKGKPKFSIFGVGDYSFKPYKVAISGMYKTTHFTLVSSIDNKPTMLDDTCYFIGFDNLIDARIAHYILNHNITQQFIKSIIFSDSKRPITKKLLMRINIVAIYDQLSINNSFASTFKNCDWENFKVKYLI